MHVKNCTETEPSTSGTMAICHNFHFIKKSAVILNNTSFSSLLMDISNKTDFLITLSQKSMTVTNTINLSDPFVNYEDKVL
jgi:hypothetical protein